MGYRIVRMTNELFQMFLTEGNRFPDRAGRSVVCTQGLPAGAKLEAVSSDLHFDAGQISLRFSHPSWPDVPSCHAIPELDIQFGSEDSPFVGVMPPSPLKWETFEPITLEAKTLPVDWFMRDEIRKSFVPEVAAVILGEDDPQPAIVQG